MKFAILLVPNCRLTFAKISAITFLVAILVIHCRPTELETGQNGANGTDAVKSADLKPLSHV